MISRLYIEDAYKALDELFDYLEHVLEMPNPPMIVPVPFKLLKRLRNAAAWEPNPKVEE